MNHFAYPNVLPREGAFIGCGRYRVLAREQVGSLEGYREIAETPNTPNRSHLEHALQLLSPGSFDAEQVIVEKQDQPRHRYQGNSLDLAYFLAHTQRSRQLKLKISGDIWCTGAIELKDGAPYLYKVDHRGFLLKLAHFLDTENSDRLFIVPAANIQQEAVETAAAGGAQLRSLRQLNGGWNGLSSSDKVILKVLPGELADLVELLFLAEKKHRAPWSRAVLVVLSLLVAVFAGWWHLFEESGPDHHQIEAMLAAGELSAVREMFASHQGGSPEIDRLRSLLNTTVQVDITLEARIDGEIVSRPAMLEEEKMADLTLSHQDDYRLRLSSAEPPSVRMYLYVFQFDELDQVHGLFPNVTWRSANPVETGEWPVLIPGGEGEWFYLDQLPPTRPEGMEEALHILLTPWRAEKVEGIFAAISQETDRDARRTQINALQELFNRYREAPIDSVLYRKIVFQHH